MLKFLSIFIKRSLLVYLFIVNMKRRFFVFTSIQDGKLSTMFEQGIAPEEQIIKFSDWRRAKSVSITFESYS